MERLTKGHMGLIESLTEKMALKTFYHYPPLILGISESMEKPFNIDEDGGIWADIDKKELYISLSHLPHLNINKLYICSIPSVYHSTFKSEIYDTNFIFDLKKTIDIGNFKANVKKFELYNYNYSFIKSDKSGALEVIKKWYLQRTGKAFSDFGYTLWLCEHYYEFKDIQANLVTVNGNNVAFSLWGKLSEDTAIHIISKDTRQYPYTQEYLRNKVYNDMINKGFKYVNDGSDCELHELNVFKMKLRPYLILPIWSWIKKEEKKI